MTTPNDNRKSFKVTKGNTHVTVYPYGDGWRFAWRARVSDPWKYITRAKKVLATAAAENLLDEIETGGIVWSALPAARRRFLETIHREAREEDEKAVITFLSGRQKSAEVVESVKRFLAWKIDEAGEKTPNIRNLKGHLNPMAQKFAGKTVVDVSAEELTEWWKSKWGHKSAKTRKESRGSMVAFWSWCVLMTLYPKDVVTPAQRIPNVKLEKGKRRVLTPDEFLAVAAAIRPEFRGSIVLQAFCGMRPEEVAPPSRQGMSKKSKRGIFREEFDWLYNVIRIPEEVSKTGFPRIVPILPGVEAWLEWAGIRSGQIGSICDNLVTTGETLRLGVDVFKTGWPQDALRHSFGSYRNAVIRSLDQVADEMGNSVATLQRYYHNPKAKEEGEAWFGMKPSDIR